MSREAEGTFKHTDFVHTQSSAVKEAYPANTTKPTLLPPALEEASSDQKPSQ